MGCSASRHTIKVLPKEDGGSNGADTKEAACRAADSLFSSDENEVGGGNAEEEEEGDYYDDDLGVVMRRREVGSATSRDSGLGPDTNLAGTSLLDEHVVTENSPADLVKEVEESFLPKPNLVLEIMGEAPPRNMSARDKQRLEEQRIIETLRQEGFITKGKEQSKSGISFEIVQPENKNLRKPPPRLERLSRDRKGRDFLDEAHDQALDEKLRVKLEKASRRRKELEKRRASRYAEEMVKFKHEQEELGVKEKSQQQEIDKKTKEKLEQASKLREQKAEEQAVKFKQREERIEQAHQRKLLNFSNGNGEISFEEEVRKWKEEQAADEASQ